MVSSEIWEELYPFQSKEFKLHRSPSSKLHYIDEGKGEVLLCLHGNPTWSFYFRNIIQYFKPKMRVIALDHLGCGLSSKPQGFDYTLRNHILNLEDFIESLGVKKISIFAHDWGGAIGLGWAVRHPQRVKQVILTNTAAFTSTDIPKRIALCKVPILGEFLIRRFNSFALAAAYMATKKGLSKAVKSGLLYPYKDYESRIAIAKFVQDIPLNSSHKSFEELKNIESRLPLLTCPKLLLWGMKDFCFHEGFLSRWKELYPNAQIKEFDDAGHYLLEDDPSVVIKTMEGFFQNNEYSRAH